MMRFNELPKDGLVLLGCGKMGSALLSGWLANGLRTDSIWIKEPNPSDWLRSQNIRLNTAIPAPPSVVVLAVKPQILNAALAEFENLAVGSTLIISIAAGRTLESLETILGASMPVIRAMPNTPASVNRGMTALIANQNVQAVHREIAELFFNAVGRVVWLEREADIDAVTGVSGSGPAYVFHLVEALAAAGEANGLSSLLAKELAKETVVGAAELIRLSEDSPSTLRENVTSSKGTTAAALQVLMDSKSGLAPLLAKAVEAATKRSKELSEG